MILGKPSGIQKMHWYSTGQWSWLVARISAKGQVSCWQSRRERAEAMSALADLTVYVLYSKGRQNHPLCPSVPLSHSYQRMSALTSLSLSLMLAALSHWPLSVLQVRLLRQNNNYSETTLCSSDPEAFGEVWLSSSMNPKNWSHSFVLSTAGNFLFITSGVFLLAIIFSLLHSSWLFILSIC